MPKKTDRPTKGQRFTIQNHLERMLDSPIVRQAIQRFRSMWDMELFAANDYWSVPFNIQAVWCLKNKGPRWIWGTNKEHKELDEYTQSLFEHAQHYFRGVGGIHVWCMLVTLSWEHLETPQFVSQLLDAVIKRDGITAAEWAQIAPLKITYQNPPQGKRKRPLKKKTGTFDSNKVDGYFRGSRELHPTRVWNGQDLANYFEVSSPITGRPLVGSDPITLHAGGLFIEVEPWATEEDVLEAYRRGVRWWFEYRTKEERPQQKPDKAKRILELREQGMSWPEITSEVENTDERATQRMAKRASKKKA
jgi:hypothetical protein